MSKFAHYDNDGKIIGFYDIKIHKKFPSQCIPIDDNTWRDFLENQGKWMVDVKTKTFVLTPAPDEIEIKKQNKIFEITNAIINLEKKLKDTDWFLIRLIETGVDVPIEIREERQACRYKINQFRNEIHSLKH